MTVRYQISDKRDQAILVVEVIGEDAEAAEEQFAQASAFAGLQNAYEAFTAFPRPTTPPTISQAVQNVQAAFPGAQPVQQPYAQPQVPAAAGAPVCQHGTKVLREGVSAKGPWKAWACPAPKDDPTQCKFAFIR